MISKVRRRFVLASILVLMTLGVLLPSGGTNAAPQVYYEEEITYYRDPGLTQYCGTGHIYCNGRGTLTGTSSPYHTEEELNTCCWGVPC
jgi:hypothetical protein